MQVVGAAGRNVKAVNLLEAFLVGRGIPMDRHGALMALAVTSAELLDLALADKEYSPAATAQLVSQHRANLAALDCLAPAGDEMEQLLKELAGN